MLPKIQFGAPNIKFKQNHPIRQNFFDKPFITLNHRGTGPQPVNALNH
jgi:hypothetical protein